MRKRRVNWNKIIVTKQESLIHQQVISKVHLKLLQIEDPKPKKIILCGSAARNTYLRKGRKDFDYFLYYPAEDPFILDSLEIELKKRFSEVTRIWTGFPYFRAVWVEGTQKYYLDFIVCFYSSEYEPDKTELAQKYVSGNLTEELRRQILKLKYYLKRNKLYGASSEISGFSGYAVQCMIIKYKCLQNIPYGLQQMEDPVGSNRNLLASVSKSNLNKFHVLNCLRYKNNRSVEEDAQSKNIYYIENPPLKYWNLVLKDPYVVSVVYTPKVMIFEIRDLYKNVDLRPQIGCKRQIWTKNRYKEVYLASKYPTVRYSFQNFLKNNFQWNIKKVANSEKKKYLLKMYYALK